MPMLSPQTPEPGGHPVESPTAEPVESPVERAADRASEVPAGVAHEAPHEVPAATPGETTVLRPLQPRLVVVAGLVWLTPDRLLVQRRAADASHGAGRLELPGGKVEPGEAPRAALTRELTEEWGPQVRVLTLLSVAEVLHHIYPAPGPEVLLVVYHVDASAWAGADDNGERWPALARAVDGASVHAFDREALPLDEFLAADRGFLAEVRAGWVRRPGS